MTEAAVIDTNEYIGSCTFLSMLGDIVIAWDDQNKEKILEVIRKKMSEGYVFFTTKTYLFGKIKRKSEITNRDLSRGNIKDIIIPDEEFDKMVKDMNDSDIANLVLNENVVTGKRKGKGSIDTVKRAKTAEDVIKSQSVAIRPIRAG